MWDRLFLRCLCSAACVCLALLGIAAWNAMVMGDPVVATWFAATAIELFLCGCIALLFYVMVLI